MTRPSFALKTTLFSSGPLLSKLIASELAGFYSLLTSEVI